MANPQVNYNLFKSKIYASQSILLTSLTIVCLLSHLKAYGNSKYLTLSDYRRTPIASGPTFLTEKSTKLTTMAFATPYPLSFTNK